VKIRAWAAEMQVAIWLLVGRFLVGIVQEACKMPRFALLCHRVVSFLWC
jgi:hypothetical protein